MAMFTFALKITDMNPIDLTSIQNEIKANSAVLIYFFSNNCAPCISLRPKIQALISEDYDKIKMILIDSEQHPEITAHYGVFANPTLLLFFEGNEHLRWSKYVSVSQIAEAIDRPYNLLFE